MGPARRRCLYYTTTCLLVCTMFRKKYSRLLGRPIRALHKGKRLPTAGPAQWAAAQVPGFPAPEENGLPWPTARIPTGGQNRGGFPFPLPRLLPPIPPAQQRAHPGISIFPPIIYPSSPLLSPFPTPPTHLRIPTSEPSALAASNPPTPRSRIRKATRRRSLRAAAGDRRSSPSLAGRRRGVRC